MRSISVFLMLILTLNLTACSSANQKTSTGIEPPSTSQPKSGESPVNITIDTTVGDVLSDPSFKDFGRLLKSNGIDTEFHSYNGLGHGFGLGTGTVADGWINDAVAFWEKQMKTEE